MNKFEKFSLFNIDFTLRKGNDEELFVFKPLPFKYYPKLFDLIKVFREADIDESLSEEERNKKLAEVLLNSDTMGLLLDLEQAMVKNSYPEIKDEVVEAFVIANSFELIEPLFKMIPTVNQIK